MCASIIEGCTSGPAAVVVVVIVAFVAVAGVWFDFSEKGCARVSDGEDGINVIM